MVTAGSSCLHMSCHITLCNTITTASSPSGAAGPELLLTLQCRCCLQLAYLGGLLFWCAHGNQWEGPVLVCIGS